MHPLRRYMQEEGLTRDQFGQEIGLSGNMVTKVTAPEDASYFRPADYEVMRRTAIATNGRIMPNDWVFPDGMPEECCQRRARRKRAAA